MKKRLVSFGELMARLTPPPQRRWGHAIPGGCEVSFAGSEANVAVAYRALGGQAAFVSALPDHPWAGLAVVDLDRRKVETRHVVQRQPGRMGLYFVEPGTMGRATMVVYDRAHSAFAAAPANAYDWPAVFAGPPGIFFISGITPAVAPEAASRAIAAARAAAWTVAFDPNLRRSLWTPGPENDPMRHASRVLTDLAAQSDILIGSPSQAEWLTGTQLGHPDHTLAAAEQSARAVARRFPALKWIGWSLRESRSADACTYGGFLFDVKNECGHAAPWVDGQYVPHDVPSAVDRIGTGDAFAAALLLALHDDDDNNNKAWSAPGRAVAFAAAAGFLNHGVYGDYHIGGREEVVAVVEGHNAGHVRR